MAIGNPVNPGLVNAQLGNVVAGLRNASTAAVNFQNEITAIGQAGLEAAGFTADDATALIAAASLAATPAKVFYGDATQDTLYNFDTALAGYAVGS